MLAARAPARRISSRIAACVVTSRPVVGSSAISSAGRAGERDRDHHALAHAARQLERIGARSAARGRGSAPAPSSSIAARASSSRAASVGVCARSTSSIWRPDRPDRIERRARVLEDHRRSRGRAARASVGSLAVSRSRPPKTALPPRDPRGGGRGCRAAASAVTDLPEPLSPTRPTVSPAATSKRDVVERVHDRRRACGTRRARSSTAQRAAPAALTSRRLGSMMSRSPSPSRLKQNTASISASAGEERHPPLAGDDEGRAFGDHDPPLRRRRPHAEADERQAGRVEDRPAHVQRDLHHHRRQAVREQVHGEDARGAVAREPRRLDEAGVAAHVDLGAGHAARRTAG